MPKKILNSYGGFTADQWKSFTTLFSIYVLSSILPEPDLDVWRYFVLACSYICLPVITETKAMLAHSCLLNFCKGFQQLYGKHNIHLHTHLLYSFWLFSFERYNGIIGDYGTNQRAVEIQLMRKFTSNQFVKDVPLPVEFHKYFEPVMERLNSRQAGSLQDNSEGSIGRNLILSSMLSVGAVQKRLTWSNTDSLFKCHGPHYMDCLDSDLLPHLKECYNVIFDAVDEESITGHCNRYAFSSSSSERYGSSLSRGDRCSFILARWCTLGGKIDSARCDLRPGIIDYFLEQNITANGQSVPCILATLRWFQSHPSQNCLGAPVEVWCKDLFE